MVLHYFDNHWGGLFYVLSAFFLLNTLISLFALSPSPKIKGIIIELKEKIKQIKEERKRGNRSTFNENLTDYSFSQKTFI